MTEETFSLKAEVSKEIHYNDTFGVYGFYPVEKNSGIELNSYGNFVVSGVTFQLIEGAEYEIEIQSKEDKKYGKGWNFVSVKQDRPSTVTEQQVYMKALLAESFYKAIINHYPNEKVLDLIQEDKFDYENVKGIGKKTYIKIKEKLLGNLEIIEAIAELQDLQITFPQMKKLVDHFGSPQIVIQKINNNIYSLCSVGSFGFKTVDKFALNRGDDKKGRNRIMAALAYLLRQEEDSGNCWTQRFTLIESMRELLQIDRATIENEMLDLDESIYSDGERLALLSTYETEKNIKHKLLRLLKEESNIKIKNATEKIAIVESEQGFSFTDEQLTAINLAIKHNVLIINGKGGVGKTATLKGILGVMNNYTHAACALSGKAAKVMEKHGLNASTIHRLLGWDSTGFKYNSEDPMPYHIIVIDETSMINSHLFYAVVRAVQSGSKLIILGDSGQLAGIGVGAVFRDLTEAELIPRIELTKVQRQAKKSGILVAANEVREGKQIINSGSHDRKIFGELKDFVVFPQERKESIQDLVIQVAEKFKNKDLFEFQIITGRKSGGDLAVDSLNTALQAIYNPRIGTSYKRFNTHFYAGDKVIQHGNMNKYKGEKGMMRIFNGTLGVIKGITKGVKSEDVTKEQLLIHIKFEDIDEIIKYTEEDFRKVDLAYAITCHKSQGSTIKHVLFAFDYSSYNLLSKNLIYTGITRASEGCVMICELKALRYGIATDVSENRRTFLREFLRE